MTDPTDMRAALAELVEAHDALQARSWPGGPAEYEQQRDRLRAAWVAARLALSAHGSEPAEPVAWRTEAAKWLRRKASEGLKAAAATGHGNPAWWRPAILDGAAEELDAEQETAPYGLEPWQVPIVNKFGDTLKPEVQRFMGDAVTHLSQALAAPPAPVAPEPPEGWVLVPKEPTEAMQAAAIDYARSHNRVAFSDGYYRAMLAAAPTTTPEAKQP